MNLQTYRQVYFELNNLQGYNNFANLFVTSVIFTDTCFKWYFFDEIRV